MKRNRRPGYDKIGTKYRNGKQKRKLLASNYHQNPARIYADALAEDAKQTGVGS